MSRLRFVILGSVLVMMVVVFSCSSGSGGARQFTDTPKKGRITISADESFRPIVDALVQVYESNNDSTKINVQYKPESECVADLFNDSIRMVISTVKLSDEQLQSVVDSLHLVVKQLPVARDAVAVIVNPSSRDTLLSMEEIKMILTGTYTKPLKPVLDGLSATSTVRFLLDSVLKGQKMTSDAMGANTSDSVIQFVAGNPNAIGFIGVSWIGNKDDAEQLSFLKKVKIVQLESSDKPGRYVLPVQANIYTKRYPMTRDLVYILKEGHRGLGTGFAEFVAGEIGQLIFKRAYLMPGRRSFLIRPAQTKE
ncbi:PstS family phosphate ABC transporter substrate-binding protein [Niabella drilacis]|uniref:Phosphate transport system substrate-binding protein n=1 Tax=Niabella drilacis (strain DSM 25811 / CCM 8410 / CCUG 62505 / LMG 26954 / E90) TaxID=1285928 RepID=A0A1G6VN12_NIADE|nr:substrate-binding domain-containing protein [Niabella drilacis]SDD54275.1 phosphate transport system substrate-binding protein [Niabella drilacis]